MASVTLKRGTKAEIESTQIQDGQLLMETDQLNNNKIYLDLPNGTRVPVGGSGAWVGTKEEFELAVEEGKIADGTQVIITDDYESGITASMTLYSNSQSGLVATNVQSAIDELDSAIDTLNSNFVKSANWETLFEDNNGVAQNNGIYFDTKGYKVFAVQVSGESLIFVRLYTTDLQNISAGIPVLINNGTMWISVNRIIRFDSYSDHWYIQQLADFDTAGNSYSDGRKVYAIYGVK